MLKKSKVLILGVLAAALLLGGVAVASQNTRNITVRDGVRVSLNGQIVDFPDDMRPFVVVGDERTFLSVRAMADMVGLGVGFDPATNTVLLTGGGDAPQRATEPTPLTQSFFTDNLRVAQELGDIGAPGDGTAFVRAQDSVSMGGQTFSNAIAFRSGAINPALGAYSVHRLNGRYTTLVGTVGRIGGSGESTGSLWRIWGDGVVIAQFDHSLSDGRTINNEPPRAIEVDVSGVNNLTIEVTIWSRQGQRAEFAFAGETRP